MLGSISVSRRSYIYRLYEWAYRVFESNGPAQPSIIKLTVLVPLMALVEVIILIGLPMVTVGLFWAAGLVVVRSGSLGWWTVPLLLIALSMAIWYLAMSLKMWSLASTWFYAHCYQPVQAWYNRTIPRVTFQ